MFLVQKKPNEECCSITLRTSGLLGSDAHVINLDTASLVSLVLVRMSADMTDTSPRV